MDIRMRGVVVLVLESRVLVNVPARKFRPFFGQSAWKKLDHVARMVRFEQPQLPVLDYPAWPVLEEGVYQSQRLLTPNLFQIC